MVLHCEVTAEVMTEISVDSHPGVAMFEAVGEREHLVPMGTLEGLTEGEIEAALSLVLGAVR